MKKIITIFAVLLMMGALVACGPSDEKMAEVTQALSVMTGAGAGVGCSGTIGGSGTGSCELGNKNANKLPEPPAPELCATMPPMHSTSAIQTSSMMR